MAVVATSWRSNQLNQLQGSVINATVSGSGFSGDTLAYDLVIIDTANMTKFSKTGSIDLATLASAGGAPVTFDALKYCNLTRGASYKAVLRLAQPSDNCGEAWPSSAFATEYTIKENITRCVVPADSLAVDQLHMP